MQHMLSAWKIGQSSSSYWSRIWNLAIQLERVKGVTKTVIFSLWHAHTYIFPKFLMVPMYLPHFQSYCKIVRLQSEFEYDFIESFVPLCNNRKNYGSFNGWINSYFSLDFNFFLFFKKTSSIFSVSTRANFHTFLLHSSVLLCLFNFLCVTLCLT